MSHKCAWRLLAIAFFRSITSFASTSLGVRCFLKSVLTIGWTTVTYGTFSLYHISVATARGFRTVLNTLHVGWLSSWVRLLEHGSALSGCYIHRCCIRFVVLHELAIFFQHCQQRTWLLFNFSPLLSTSNSKWLQTLFVPSFDETSLTYCCNWLLSLCTFCFCPLIFFCHHTWNVLNPQQLQKLCSVSSYINTQ